LEERNYSNIANAAIISTPTSIAWLAAVVKLFDTILIQPELAAGWCS
tara:strand:- start:1149 stop:1289 length:141 start_codon:yes stop_codon:yes gene_type:complete